MDSAASDEDGSKFSSWCDKHFDNMYSPPTSRKPKVAPMKKTLYTTSQEKILAGTKQQYPRFGNGDHKGVKQASSSNWKPDIRRHSPGKKTSPSKFRPNDTLIKHEHNESVDGTELKKISNPSDFTSDAVVSKRCLLDDIQEPEISEGKTKKKKHKKHALSPSARYSTQIDTVGSDKELNQVKQSRSKVKMIKYNSSKEFQRMDDNKTKEGTSPRKSSPGKGYQQQMMKGSPKKTYAKITSNEKQYSEDTDKPILQKSQNRSQSIKDETGFLTLLNNPLKAQPPKTECIQIPESIGNHQRTESTSSISSTSTSASSTSVASGESLSCTDSKIFTKTTKTTKTVVSFKTKSAKNLYKPKNSKERLDRSEKPSFGKHGSRFKEEMIDEKTTNKKEKTVKQLRRPDAAKVLSHIKKSLASSGTDSELEGSPVKSISLSDVKECTEKKPLAEKNQNIHIQKSKSGLIIPAKESIASSEDVNHLKEQQKFDIRNSMYKFEDKTKRPFSLACNFANTTYRLSDSTMGESSSPLINGNVAQKSVSQKVNDSVSGKREDVVSHKADIKGKDAISDNKMPELEEYNVDESDSESDDDSWSQMVEQISQEKEETKWDFIVDSNKRRLCVEGTTYAAPPVQWRTNWYMHRPGMALVRPPLPTAPPPPRPSYPPPVRAPPTGSLYEDACRRMCNPPPTSPFLKQNAWPSPQARKKDYFQEDMTTKKPDLEEGELEEFKDEIFYSSDEEQGIDSFQSPRTSQASYSGRRSQPGYMGQHSGYSGQFKPSYSGQSETSYSGQYQTSYSGQSQNPWQTSNPRNLPPRLLKQQQQYSQNYQSPSSQSPWSQSYNQQDSGVVSTWDNYNSGYGNPRSSWSARKSFSPGTPFEYDTSAIVYPYSMEDFIDTHCHIDFLYQRLGYKGTFGKFCTEYHFPPNYAGCVAIFCTPESLYPHGLWKDLLQEDNVWGAFGVHPHHIKYYDGRVEENIYNCMKHPKAVAVGEIGLDYSNRNTSDWILQQEVLRRQLKIALELKKPLVIHSRDAEDDTLDIMAAMVPMDYPIHRHCFTGTPEEARRWFSYFPKSFIGLTSLVTFGSAFSTHRTAIEIPLNRLLLETDAPYFLPKQVPKTLKYANPSMAVFVAERIARLKGITTDEVLTAVRKNTTIMYGI